MCKEACNGVCTSFEAKSACNNLQHAFDLLLDQNIRTTHSTDIAYSEQLADFQNQLENLIRLTKKETAESDALKSKIEGLKQKLDNFYTTAIPEK
ncbi:hypothetical protein BH09BAC2_BH09BAC2_17640 [soil metagenome]